MNPQRTELEFAIRTVLRQLGVSVHIPKRAFSSCKSNVTSDKQDQGIIGAVKMATAHNKKTHDQGHEHHHNRDRLDAAVSRRRHSGRRRSKSAVSAAIATGS